MKANAPEKIYLSQERDKDGCYVDLMWHKHPYKDMENIQYVRTDAFIEKASTWIANRYQANGSYLNADDIEDFEKYMKGDNMTKEIEEIKEYDGKISSNIVTVENNWYVCIKQFNNFEVGKVYCIGKNTIIAVPEYFRLATDEEISQGASMQNTDTTEPTGVRLEKCPKAQKGE